MKDTLEALEQRVKDAQLYDLYGPLLTGRQRRAFELHSDEDLSLSEMARELGTSRQAASALVQSSRAKLADYEALLGFCAKIRAVQGALKDLEGCLGDVPSAQRAIRRVENVLKGE
ncbi:sigma factor-like helix-turn-helix DNA-binding protein [Jonquetella anthropi]|uniref:sigma factor-like helix-turn-helix DNA-binding protein n=1 Tax=Jonquetella anthropi TaxID=428712 RepID=UPI0001B91083|nr:sigma factor-like helix-turn-helix DNA-binding protein [Jonquetella anthropi]EEX48600.1 helix-turn-helix protein, YlxM/p13 family [Jonquetella anthropi E3_33 E1]